VVTKLSFYETRRFTTVMTKSLSLNTTQELPSLSLWFISLIYPYLQLRLPTVLIHWVRGKRKAIPIQAWTSPEGSRKLRLPDFKKIGT